MNPRRLVLLLAAIACWLPPPAWPQQPTRLPMVAILSDGGPTACGSGNTGEAVACMVDGLRALGHVAGQNVTLEYRYARGDFTRMPALAAELVALRPDVLYTLTTPGADAAAGATATIPIVVGPAGQPTLMRLAGSLARPTGNVTGLTTSVDGADMSKKCLQLLKELAPRTARVAVLFNPGVTPNVALVDDLERAVGQLGIVLQRVEARNAADLRQAFAAIAGGRADAILMLTDGNLAGNSGVRRLVNDWAASQRMPVVALFSPFAADGALLTLATDLNAIARRAAFYVHRLLGGAKPGDLPIERPTVFKLSLNRKTAAALGITIPPSVLLRADEVLQ